MTKLEHALALAEQGFYVFPVNGKIPAINNWPHQATQDVGRITRWFKQAVHTNIGIATGKGSATIVVDVDTKVGKKGAESLDFLLSTFGPLSTYRVQTPSGGQHLYFWASEPVKNSVEKIMPGIDIRSAGGYVVAAGSTGYAVLEQSEVVRAPDWLIAECERASPVSTAVQVSPGYVNQDTAIGRAREYLAQRPGAVQGSGGDVHTFATVAKLKDLGVNREDVLELLEPWNETCSPPWDAEDLETKIRNAYQYGENPIGSAAPEADFSVVEVLDAVVSPLHQMNREYALVRLGGDVVIMDSEGQYLAEPAFHKLLANKLMPMHNKLLPISRVWMSWEHRRTYKNVVFAPGAANDPGILNLWRGFSYAPAQSAAHPAVARFLEHVRTNLCASDTEHADWVLGWMAHLFQKPEVKPLVALVFRGAKGTGKSVVFNIIGKLVDAHHLVTSQRRYLTSNFTGHFENVLLAQFEEIQWAGDPIAENVLKDLITGNVIMIERKGMEPYPLANLMRLVLISNADWVVPATIDERRFAVFDVGADRQADLAYFRQMREGMEAGGYAALLRYFLDYDLKGVEVDEAPNTLALSEQKMESLRPVANWWMECVTAGNIVGAAHLGDNWPDKLPTADALAAFTQYTKGRNIKERLPGPRQFGDQWRKASGIVAKARNVAGGPQFYDLPLLEESRENFAAANRMRITWADE